VTSIAQEETVLTRRARRWESLLPYGLILPTVAYLGLFFVWPMIQGFGLALRDETGNWTLSAFDTMVNDAAFDDAMRFTFLLILVIVPIQFVLAFGMALLLNARLRGGGIFLYIFLLPLAISDLAAGIAWSAIFTERGYLNTILEGIGVIDQPFIFLDPTSETQLVLCVAAAEIWRSTTFMMVILFAGLQAIPRDYVAAAALDPGRAPPPPDLRLRGLRGRHRVDGGRCARARVRGLHMADDERERARGCRILDGHPRAVAGGGCGRARCPAHAS
jgi:ABC-type sugar transport system permease subunit